MKTTSLKSSLVFVILLAAVTSCNLQNKKADAETQYQKIVPILNKGNFMRHEGEPDSAIAYYMKGRSMLQTLLAKIDSGKDTSYSIALGKVDNLIGYMYDTLDIVEKSLPYFRESLKWADHNKLPMLRLDDEEMISFDYRHIYNKYEEKLSPDSLKSLVLKSRDYLLNACWDIDKLKLNKTNRALGDYHVMTNIYETLGDTTHEKFYYEKYSALHDELNGIERPIINN